MLDCMKTYKMVLSDDDGNVYKSNNVEIRNANVYFTGRDIDKFAEIELVMRRLCIEEAETPPEMPLAETAAQATKIIQEERYKAAIEEQWINLTEMVCKAIKKGESYIIVKSLWLQNEARLTEMGYKVSRLDNSHEWKIQWAPPFYFS